MATGSKAGGDGMADSAQGNGPKDSADQSETGSGAARKLPATLPGRRDTVPAPARGPVLPNRAGAAPRPPGPRGPAPDRADASGAPPARIRRRHRLLAASFVVTVILPAIGAVWYLETRAQDRYASSAAFFVHREDTTPSVETLFGLSALGGSSNTPDAEVLYQFIQSQKMVETADAAIDLRAHYSEPYDIDPVFALDPDATLEEMVEYWNRIVTILLEPDTGLITLEVTAFDPETAQRVAQVILDTSAKLIEEISQIARNDLITQAQGDLALAEERVREARIAIASFRNSAQFVDPSAAVAGTEGVITALEQRLAGELINRDALEGTTTRPDDPRIERADRTIAAIRARIAAERANVGEEDAAAVGAYEELLVDRTFAEQAYTAALGAHDAAVAEARRKSRYLATHIPPTRADTAIYPERITLAALATGFLFMAWAVGALVYYSLKDRH